LEKSFLRKLTPKRKFDELFYRDIKDLPQYEKYEYLKEYLIMFNYNFEANLFIKNAIDKVINFFFDRSKWRGLYKTLDDIIRLNMNFKTIGNENTKISNSFSKESFGNETEELRVRFVII
jgi:hypothetical protein